MGDEQGSNRGEQVDDRENREVYCQAVDTDLDKEPIGNECAQDGGKENECVEEISEDGEPFERTFVCFRIRGEKSFVASDCLFVSGNSLQDRLVRLTHSP